MHALHLCPAQACATNIYENYYRHVQLFPDQRDKSKFWVRTHNAVEQEDRGIERELIRMKQVMQLLRAAVDATERSARGRWSPP